MITPTGKRTNREALGGSTGINGASGVLIFAIICIVAAFMMLVSHFHHINDHHSEPDAGTNTYAPVLGQCNARIFIYYLSISSSSPSSIHPSINLVS
jgi:hypothetical protein